MSALGQKQTCAMQTVMSALPLKADMCSHCPMSALGQKQTHAVHNGMSALHPKADMCSALGYVCFGPKSNLSVAALGFPLYLQLQNAEAVALLAMASAYERTLERTTSPTLALVVSPTGSLQCQSMRGLLGWTNSTLYWVPVNKAARSASLTFNVSLLL